MTMNLQDFRNILTNRKDPRAAEELEEILEAELRKPTGEMDADFIEYCLDARLQLQQEKKALPEQKKAGGRYGNHITRWKRIAILAAAVAMLLLLALSVSALVFQVNLFDGMVSFYDEHIRIHFDENEAQAEEYRLLGSSLAEELAKSGITPVLLPEALLSDGCEITAISCETLDGMISALVNYTQNGKEAYMTIDRYISQEAVPYVDFLNAEEIVEKIDIGTISVYVLKQNDRGTIAYQDGTTVYYIVTPLSFEDAIAFAKTIK